MAVHAHPDDESSKGAATMARYSREGVEVLVATLTGGERVPPARAADLRRERRLPAPGPHQDARGVGGRVRGGGRPGPLPGPGRRALAAAQDVLPPGVPPG